MGWDRLRKTNLEKKHFQALFIFKSLRLFIVSNDFRNTFYFNIVKQCVYMDQQKNIWLHVSVKLAVTWVPQFWTNCRIRLAVDPIESV